MTATSMPGGYRWSAIGVTDRSPDGMPASCVSGDVDLGAIRRPVPVLGRQGEAVAYMHQNGFLDPVDSRQLPPAARAELQALARPSTRFRALVDGSGKIVSVHAHTKKGG